MALVVKNLPANAGDVRDMGSITGREDPLQYSCLENPMDRGAWRVHRVAESRTRQGHLSALTTSSAEQALEGSPCFSMRKN